MSWNRSGENDTKRERLSYEGFQVKDWINDLIQEKGVMQIDISRMIGVSPKTVSQWVTGVSFPNPSAAKSLILALAPGYEEVEARKHFIETHLSVYQSIRSAYTKTSVRYNKELKGR